MILAMVPGALSDERCAMGDCRKRREERKQVAAGSQDIKMGWQRLAITRTTLIVHRTEPDDVTANVWPRAKDLTVPVTPQHSTANVA